MLKKITALFVMSTLVAQTLVWAAPTATPEFTLVESMVALQGQKLSQSALQSQATQLLSSYNTVAKKEGQNERFKQALVGLGIYTPSQADSFMSDASGAAQRIGAQNMNETAMNLEIQTLANVHPMGAQFSMCVAMIPVFLGAVVAGVCLLNVNETAADALIIVGMAAGFIGFVSQEVEGC